MLAVENVIVKFETSPATAVIVDGDAVIEKSDEAELTVRLSGRLNVEVALVPITVIGYTPAAVVLSAAIVSVVAPAPLTVDWLKLGFAPDGSPFTVNETAGLGSLPGTTLIVKLVLLPPRTEAEVVGLRIRNGCRNEASPPWLNVSYTMMWYSVGFES